MSLNQKNIVFILGLIFLIWVAYLFSFSKTIEAFHTYNKLKYQDDLFTSASQNHNNLQQQVKYYNSLLKKYQISAENSFQNNLLNTINDYAKSHPLKIINFKNPNRFLPTNHTIQETYVFTVESDFNSIVNLIYTLEQNHKFGEIVSVNFEKKKDYKTNLEYLQCEIYLQRVLQDLKSH